MVQYVYENETLHICNIRASSANQTYENSTHSIMIFINYLFPLPLNRHRPRYNQTQHKLPIVHKWSYPCWIYKEALHSVVWILLIGNLCNLGNNDRSTCRGDTQKVDIPFCCELSVRSGQQTRFQVAFFGILSPIVNDIFGEVYVYGTPRSVLNSWRYLLLLVYSPEK